MKYQDGAYLHKDKVSTKQMLEASLCEVNKNCVCLCPISIISKTVLKKGTTRGDEPDTQDKTFDSF